MTDWEIVTNYTDPSFKTHLNYIEHLNSTSEGIKLKTILNIRSKIPQKPILLKKVKLAVLTKKNLDSEMEIIEGIKEYATVCSSWIAVKSYYLIFNLSLLLEYLVSGGFEVENVTHTKLLDKIKKRIGNDELVFSNNSFNRIYSPTDVYRWKFKTGSNLSSINTENRDKQIIKKLCDYAKQEFKRKINKQSLKGKNKEVFFEKTSISLFDFFYWYRIKVNYRDLEFLDSEVGENQFYEYYKNYYEATHNLSNALMVEINRLSKIRFSKELFK